MAHIANILYPVFLYFLISEGASLVMQLLAVSGKMDAVMRQGICSACGFAALLWYQNGKRKRALCSRKLRSKDRNIIGIGCIVSVLLLSAASIAMNNLISMTALKQISSGYQSVENAFYSSTLLWEILILCLFVPVVEEILYRQMVYEAVAEWFGDLFAIVLSALLFALFHGNIVQFLYALVLGICLGLVRANFSSVLVPILGHISANLISILRGTTKGFTFVSSGSSMYIQVTGILVVVSILIVIYLGIRLHRMG